jgi:hypothetical protein
MTSLRTYCAATVGETSVKHLVREEHYWGQDCREPTGHHDQSEPHAMPDQQDQAEDCFQRGGDDYGRGAGDGAEGQGLGGLHDQCFGRRCAGEELQYAEGGDDQSEADPKSGDAVQGESLCDPVQRVRGRCRPSSGAGFERPGDRGGHIVLPCAGVLSVSGRQRSVTGGPPRDERICR